MTDKNTYWVLKTDYPSYYSARFMFVGDINFAEVFSTEEQANRYIKTLRDDGITAELRPVKVARETKEI